MMVLLIADLCLGIAIGALAMFLYRDHRDVMAQAERQWEGQRRRARKEKR